MNRVELIGGLVRPPDLRYTEGGMAIAETTLAVNGARYDSKTREQIVTTAYIAVTAFGVTAEQIAEYDKGDELHVIGELEQRTMEKDGKKESKTRVTALVVSCTRQRSGGKPPRPAQDAGFADEPPHPADPDMEPF